MAFQSPGGSAGYADTPAKDGFGEGPKPGSPDSNKETSGEDSAKKWMTRIDRCKRVRRDLVKTWSDNVDYRRGKPFTEYDDQDRINVNIDWAMTKAKHAQLYSQTPKVYLTAKQKQFDPAVPVFGKQLNDTLDSANMGSAMDECILDAINASGVGVLLTGYEALTQPKQIPSKEIENLPLPQLLMMKAGLMKVPMETVDEKVSERYYIRRLSPSDFLWPVEFTGSNFDDADWLGHSGKMLWADAQRLFNLDEEDKEKILGERGKEDNLRRDTEKEYGDEAVVDYDEVFYWCHRFDPEEKYFKKIGRVVFVKGKTEPVIPPGPWEGQRFDEQSKKYVGACKFPVRVLTLTYISDDAIPPSDSAIGRPQVEEMIRSRTQIVMNRDRSQPLRWLNTDRVDPMVIDTIMRGEDQAFVPIQGDGQKAMGEVARAAYPPEDFEFDRIIREDLNEQWNSGANQMGQSSRGRRSATEQTLVQNNFQTRIGYERNRVAAFVTGTAEVVGGLLALNGDFPLLGQEEQQRLGAVDWKHISNEMVFWIRPDSTVLLDANQRIERLMKVLNLVGKSGFVNPKPIIAEIIELHGLDPADVVVDPKPPVEKPNISYRFSGVEDLTNALVVALLLHNGQAPTPQEMQAAKLMLQDVSAPIAPPQGGQGGAPGQPPPPGGGPQPQGNHPGAQPPIGKPASQMMTRPPADAHPHWGGMPKIFKRSSDI